MISGALCFDNGWSPKNKAETIAKASSEFGLFEPRALYESERLHIHSLEREGSGFRIFRSTRPDGNMEWILADVGYSAQGERLLAGASASALGVPASLPGCWLSVYVDAQTEALHIANDDLGLAWLFIGRVPGGYVFSSHFGAVARNLAGKPSLNDEALLAELAIARCFGESTIAKEIIIAPPGSAIELAPSELKIRGRQRYRYGDRFSGLTRDEKFRALDGVYERIVKEYVAGFGRETVMSLSGGYDSRTALACLHRHGMRPPLFTFASAVGNEVREARRVAAKFGEATTVFDIPTTDWRDWTSRVDAIGTSGMLLFSGWCEPWLSAIRTKGTALVIGYLGDTITGKKLAKCEKYAEGGGWAEAWARWEMANKGSLDSNLIRSDKKALIRDMVHESSKNEFREVDCAYPFQRVLHGDLYGRQARRVASQPNVLSRFVTPVLFFYDRELIDFWCNLPFEDLYRQDLYYAYGQSRFPLLFPPRDDRGSRPSWLSRAARFTRGIVGRRREAPTMGVINHWAIMQRHRNEILALAESTARVLDPYLDLGALVRYVNGEKELKVGASEAIQAINLMILADAIW